MRIKRGHLIEIHFPEFYTIIVDGSLFLFLSSTVCARILFHSQLSLSIAIGFLVIAGLIGLYELFKDRNKYCIAYSLFMAIMWGVIAFFKNGNQYYQLKDVCNSFLFLGIAYLLLTTQKNYYSYKLLYYFVSSYFLIEIVLFKKPIKDLLADGNTYNYISCYVLVLFIIYAFILLKNNKKPGILDSVLLISVVLVSYGRGGIITGSFYTLGFVLLRLYEKRSKPYTYVLVMGAISLCVLYFHKIVSLLLNDARLAKFAQNGLDTSGRDYLWNTFLLRSGESFYSFFLGANPELIRPDANLHNSFLQMWAALGLVFFIVNVFLVIICIVRGIQQRELFYVLLLVTFVLRASTDKMMFRWYGEIIMYFSIMRLLIDETGVLQIVPGRSTIDGIKG